MDWPFRKKPDKHVELQLYDSFPSPTKIKENGKPPANIKEAERIRADFLRLDAAYDRLFKNTFETMGGIDEIDEAVSGFLADAAGGLKFSVTAKNGARIHALSNFFGTDMISFSVNDRNYQLIKLGPWAAGYSDLPKSEKGYYDFNGNLKEKDYRELVEPNSPVGTVPLSREIRKLCRQNADGKCVATERGDAVPALVRRILSYADNQGTGAK